MGRACKDMTKGGYGSDYVEGGRVTDGRWQDKKGNSRFLVQGGLVIDDFEGVGKGENAVESG